MAGNYIIPKAGDKLAGLVYRQVITTPANKPAHAIHTWFVSAVLLDTKTAVQLSGTVQSRWGHYVIVVESPAHLAGLTCGADYQTDVKPRIEQLFNMLYLPEGVTTL